MPAVHSSFLRFFRGRAESEGLRILDVGAGEGALTRKLHQMGYRMRACELFPENFKATEIPCDAVDVTQSFPYPDHSFDLAIAVEVTEHILDHEVFFSEIARILKPGGRLYVSTPNILSMKSRVRFLFRGFPFAFNPLEMANYNGLQHVSSLSLDQYNYLAVKHGFGPADYDIDREQGTSRFLRFLLFPMMLVSWLLKRYTQLHNEKKLQLGRLLFMVFEKK
jgi:SAM-dependent methyltransferase